MSMYREYGMREAVAQAFHRLPQAGVTQALQVIAQHIPIVLERNGPLFPEAPVHIVSNPLFTPIMRLISERLNQLFSGEEGRNALVVLLTIGKEERSIGREMTKDGHNEFGIDCYGPYRRFFFRAVRFRPKKKSTVSRASFEELCFFSEDPKEVYRLMYQLLTVSATYLLGKKEGKS